MSSELVDMVFLGSKNENMDTLPKVKVEIVIESEGFLALYFSLLSKGTQFHKCT